MTISEINTRMWSYQDFIESMLDPERFGLAVSAEVRDKARVLLGLKPVEQNLYK